jgi:hypothetical protein
MHSSSSGTTNHLSRVHKITELDYNNLLSNQKKFNFNSTKSEESIIENKNKISKLFAIKSLGYDLIDSSLYKEVNPTFGLNQKSLKKNTLNYSNYI